MAKLSEKASRPRQYVFHHLCKSRIESLSPSISKLCEQERQQTLNMRAARFAAERHPASRHADNIMASGTSKIPESDEIEELELKLEVLRARKQQLFERLSYMADIENRQAKQTDANDNGAKPKRDDSARDNEAMAADAGRNVDIHKKGHTSRGR